MNRAAGLVNELPAKGVQQAFAYASGLGVLDIILDNDHRVEFERFKEFSRRFDDAAPVGDIVQRVADLFGHELAVIEHPLPGVALIGNVQVVAQPVDRRVVGKVLIAVVDTAWPEHIERIEAGPTSSVLVVDNFT